MKKQLTGLLLLTCMMAFTIGCGTKSAQAPEEVSETEQAVTKEEQEVTDNSTTDKKKEESSSDIINITEKMYVTYVNDVYTNFEQYENKTIELEGMFTAIADEKTGKKHYFVYRTGPGCCNNDGTMCGFEFEVTGDVPNENDWIQVSGKLTTYEEDDWEYMILTECQVTIKEERGAEVVTQ